MKINKRGVQEYNAIFISFLDSPSKLSNEFHVSGMRRILIGQTVNPKTRMLKLFFENENDISKFVAEIREGCWIDFENFVYQCHLDENNGISYNSVGNGMYEVQFAFSTIKMKRKETLSLTKKMNSVNVYSTYSSPGVYLVEVKNDISELRLGGNIIKNLKINDLLVLDGNNQTVKCNGENKFSDVTLKDNIFPLLMPGINHIEIEPIEKVNVRFEFYPIWI